MHSSEWLVQHLCGTLQNHSHFVDVCVRQVHSTWLFVHHLHHLHLHLHLSLNCRGSWGNADSFTTSFLHFYLELYRTTPILLTFVSWRYILVNDLHKIYIKLYRTTPILLTFVSWRYILVNDLHKTYIELYRTTSILLTFVLCRYIPVDDLYNIYIELYGKDRISRNVITDCTLEMYAER